MRYAIAILLLIPTATQAADPKPHVKVEVTPANGVLVGQRVALVVTLYTPDFFTGTPSFALPSVPGVLIVPPTGSPLVASDAIDGTTFTTQRHEFSIYAQRPGVVTIPSFTIDFQSNAGFGKPAVDRHVVTQEVSFTTQMPPGAEGLAVVITARNLQVSEVWQPDAKSAKVGDAFTRTISVSADEVSGMTFPPFQLDAVDGLAVYPKPPQVNDRDERGKLRGERIETVIYVCQLSGEATVPERTLRWYDLEAKQMKTAILPGRTIIIAPPPVIAKTAAAAPSAAKSALGRQAFIGLCLTAVLVATGGVLVWKYGVRRYHRWRSSEAAAFAAFRHACYQNDSHAAFVTLLDWLGKNGVSTIAEFTDRAADPKLTAAMSGLYARDYAPPVRSTEPTWTGRDLYECCAAARRRSHRGATVESDLPPLNPVG